MKGWNAYMRAERAVTEADAAAKAAHRAWIAANDALTESIGRRQAALGAVRGSTPAEVFKTIALVLRATDSRVRAGVLGKEALLSDGYGLALVAGANVPKIAEDERLPTGSIAGLVDNAAKGAVVTGCVPAACFIEALKDQTAQVAIGDAHYQAHILQRWVGTFLALGPRNVVVSGGAAEAPVVVTGKGWRSIVMPLREPLEGRKIVRLAVPQREAAE